jgi:predicted aldo/keto reductase-like oxidoreductase
MFTEPARATAGEAVPDDVEAVMADHGGDARATIGALLAEIEVLRREVMVASKAVSPGYTRGWKPSAR